MLNLGKTPEAMKKLQVGDAAGRQLGAGRQLVWQAVDQGFDWWPDAGPAMLLSLRQTSPPSFPSLPSP